MAAKRSVSIKVSSDASEETLIDTDLLAAISFQESQWDPKAKSNMGVRGMMMVTLETAAIVGVEKRVFQLQLLLQFQGSPSSFLLHPC